MVLKRALGRWGASFWVLAALLTICGLVAADVARQKWWAPKAKPPSMIAEAKPAPVPVKETGFPVGARVPDFALPDHRGQLHRLSDFRGKKTVLAFFCGCERCAMMASYVAQYEEKSNVDKPQHLTVWTMPPAVLTSWQEKAQYSGTFVFENMDGPQVKRFGGYPCPRVYVLDPKGRVRYRSPHPESQPDAHDALVKLARAFDSYWVPPRTPASPAPVPGAP